MRWIRLDVDFDDTPWVFVLSAESQLAWLKLLCHVKRSGVGGKVKALSSIVAGKKWGVGEEAVTKLLQAAVLDGALTIHDGEWIITKWAEFQEPDPTATERKRAQRERERAQRSLEEVTKTSRVTSVTDGVTCRVTETETETIKATTAIEESARDHAVAAECLRILRSEGFTAEDAERLTRFGIDRIRAQIGYLAKRKVKKNRLGLLRKSIEENWPDPDAKKPDDVEFRKEPRRNLDFWERSETVVGEGPTCGVRILKLKVVNGQKLEELFDEAEWRESRRLLLINGGSG